MACNDNIECLGEFCSCGLINLPLIAPFDGVVNVEMEFNGIKLYRDVLFINGETVIIPNVFNENYTHNIRFIKDGVNVFDKTYSIKTVLCFSEDKTNIAEYSE